jgi:hypothetical protein
VFTSRIVFVLVVVVCAVANRLDCCHAQVEDRKDRIAAGKQFLSDSRVDQWEKYFSEGLYKMGRIVLNYGGRVAEESWFEDDHYLIIGYEDDKVTYTISNPAYSAMVESKNGKCKLVHVGVSASNSGLIRVGAVPFAVCSSVNFTRWIIPRHLQNGKLEISDYRKKDQKHFVEFASSDGSDQGIIELIFYEENQSILPDEAIHNKGTPDARHFVNTNFVDVQGYRIPLRLEDMNSGDNSTTEVFPQERLDQERCRLAYYGLPEPADLTVTDFGRNRNPWQVIVIGVLVAVGISSILVLWFRGKLSGAR